MDIVQMRKYVDLEIFKQGSASAKVLAPLFTAIIDKLASTSVDDGQVSTESILYTVQNAKSDASFLITLETSVLEKYNSSADWAEVRSAVEANSKIVIA